MLYITPPLFQAELVILQSLKLFTVSQCLTSMFLYLGSYTVWLFSFSFTYINKLLFIYWNFVGFVTSLHIHILDMIYSESFAQSTCMEPLGGNIPRIIAYKATSLLITGNISVTFMITHNCNGVEIFGLLMKDVVMQRIWPSFLVQAYSLMSHHKVVCLNPLHIRSAWSLRRPL